MATIVVHSDGTLTAKDSETLKESLGCNVTIITPDEADDIVIPQIQRFPALCELRKKLPHARKILDIVLMCDDDVIHYSDSDIVLFKPVTDLFPNADGTGLFFPDIHSSYSVPYYNSLTFHKVPFASRINTGLFAFPRSEVDIDYIDFLCKNDSIHRGWLLFVEQTLWAALAMKVKSFLYDPRQAVIVTDRTSWNDDIVIGHFVSTWRTRLAELTDQNSQSAPTVELALQSVRRLTVVEFLWEQAQIRLERVSKSGR